MRYTFYIESEDGTRIYSPITYAHESGARAMAEHASYIMSGGLLYCETDKMMKYGVEAVQEGE